MCHCVSREALRGASVAVYLKVFHVFHNEQGALSCSASWCACCAKSRVARCARPLPHAHDINSFPVSIVCYYYFPPASCRPRRPFWFVGLVVVCLSSSLFRSLSLLRSSGVLVDRSPRLSAAASVSPTNQHKNTNKRRWRRSLASQVCGARRAIR